MTALLGLIAGMYGAGASGSLSETIGETAEEIQSALLKVMWTVFAFFVVWAIVIVVLAREGVLSRMLEGAAAIATAPFQLLGEVAAPAIKLLKDVI